ncbi:lysylphosphatidylglycerol synthase transmembrane domain-containing protein [Streptomyces sp. NPDC056716]|uniref:lysylphosphatidylglycerol synthase transmembrane domain-containing protein n=1 Tax=unclassified Streptomyces TaxID=2593676 RepID=UPI0036CD2377
MTRAPATQPKGRGELRDQPHPTRTRHTTLKTHLGTAAGTTILALLAWRLGTGAFLDGLRRIDAQALTTALAIGLFTTVLSARRWQLVARGLRLRLPLAPAVADYYRALFLNAALPGGVLGDVDRAVRHGRGEGDLGRGIRAVVLERTAGQLVLAGAGTAVLLTLPSPVQHQTRHLTLLLLTATAGTLAVATAIRMNRPRPDRPRRTLLAEAREALLSRRNAPGVIGWSLLVLAGHLALFVVAARVAGVSAPVRTLLPLAILALLAMSVPLNVAGWGPREGVTAWAFSAAGLGAGSGLTTAVVYGVLSFAASLPGALVLAARGWTALREKTPAYAEEASSVSSEKHAPKESVRLASSSFPFSADPREGRPMTPESV